MVTASQLRAGMAIRYEGQPYKVLTCDYHSGQGKMGGSTHARLRNLDTGAMWEHGFRADLKLEELPVEKQSLSFLYSDSDQFHFMNPDSFEQVALPAELLGEQARFLQPEMQLPVEFIDGRPVSVIFPDMLDVRIAETAPHTHQASDSSFKTATLDNGVEVMVPQFIKTGEMIRLDLTTLKYVERTKGAGG